MLSPHLSGQDFYNKLATRINFTKYYIWKKCLIRVIRIKLKIDKNWNRRIFFLMDELILTKKNMLWRMMRCLKKIMKFFFEKTGWKKFSKFLIFFFLMWDTTIFYLKWSSIYLVKHIYIYLIFKTSER